MKALKKVNVIIPVFIFVVLASTCGKDQVEEAHKLVEEANENVIEANELVKKTEKKNRELFAPNIQTNEELKNYKEKMRSTAETIVEDFAKASKSAAEASGKFEKASKLKLPGRFKEYLEAKSQEYSRRSAAVEIRKGNAQAFLDYDDATMAKKFEENNEKSERLLKEAKEFSEKAEKIQQEDKEIFNAGNRVK